MRDYAGLVNKLRRSCAILVDGGKCEDCAGSRCMEIDAADAIEELLDELTTIRKQLPHWISVEERLPDDWKPVLAYDPIGHGEIGIAFIVGSLTNVVWRGVGFTNTAYPANVTHWMPLPEPPKEVEVKDALP